MVVQQTAIDSLINASICGFISSYHKAIEPLILRFKRKQYMHQYSDPDENPLISLMIATYARGKILTERTIPSILNQTYQNFEVVIVGDHCIDNTSELVQQISDSRLRFHDLPKRGKYPKDHWNRWFVQGTVPRNQGLRLARGKWLAWISDDDVLLPNHFESLLRFAQKGNYEFVSAAYTLEKNGVIITQDASSFTPRIGGMQTWLYRSYLNCFKWNVHSWRKSWNRPCDYDLQFRMVNAGVRMGFLNEVVAHVPPVEGTDTVGIEAHNIISKQELAATSLS
jgi:glycosyltransferase involved in cell wall biosynthesis